MNQLIFWLLVLFISLSSPAMERNADFRQSCLAAEATALRSLLRHGQRIFRYDDANRLTNVFVPGQWKTEFVYDGLGRRRITREYTNAAGSWSLASESHLVYNGMLPFQERDGDNNPLVTYTRGPDLSGTFQGAGGIGGLLARTDGNGSAFYHSDAGGNITALTDPSGNELARYLYDSFGRLLGKWGPLARVNRARYSSMFTGPSGIVHFPYRDYEPILQRFLTQDPIGEAGGINRYGFIHNSPLSYVDPDGLAPTMTGFTYDPKTGAVGPQYVDYHFGQDYGIGLHTPLEEPTMVQAQKMFDRAAEATYDPNVDALTTAGLYSAGVALFAMGVLEFIPDASALTRPLAKTACKTLAKDAAEQTTYLYQKLGAAGEHLKFGITDNPATRYTAAEMNGGQLNIIAQGARDDMLQLERNLHEMLPIGPEEGQRFYIQKQLDKGLTPPPYRP